MKKHLSGVKYAKVHVFWAALMSQKSRLYHATHVDSATATHITTPIEPLFMSKINKTTHHFVNLIFGKHVMSFLQFFDKN